MFSVAPIPAIVAGTVAVGDRGQFTQPGSGFLRVHQLVALIASAGTHNNFVVTFEGSHDGVSWFNVLPATVSLAPSLTISEAGVAFTKAVGLAGFVLSFDVAFAHLRFGLAGDGAGGAGFIQARSIK